MSVVVNPCQRRDSASWRGFLRYAATTIIVVQKSTGENLSRRIIVTARPALLADHKVCDCVVFERSVPTLKHNPQGKIIQVLGAQHSGGQLQADFPTCILPRIWPETTPDIASDSATARGGFDHHRMYHNVLGKSYLILPLMSRRPVFFWTWIENFAPFCSGLYQRSVPSPRRGSACPER